MSKIEHILSLMGTSNERLDEMQEALTARKGPRYAVACKAIVECTVSCTMVSSLTSLASSSLVPVVDQLLTDVGTSVIRSSTLLAFPELDPLDAPTFKRNARALLDDAHPFIAEHQRLQSLANSTLKG